MPRVKKYACICTICHKTTRVPMLCEDCDKVECEIGACDFCQRHGQCDCGGVLLPKDIISAYCKPENFIKLMDMLIEDGRYEGGGANQIASSLWNALMEGDYGK
jgi:hypothetical protein